MSAEPTTIGVARMLDDGTIEMDLRATGPGGMIGDSRVSYAPDSPHYADILSHLGGLAPGEEKAVLPFPD